MFNYDEIKLIGNIGSEVKSFKNKSGKSFAKVSIAINKRYKTNAEVKQKTTWYTLVLNNKFAELATKYFQIGELLFVRGIPHATAWIEDGEAKANLEIIVKEIGFLSRKTKEDQSGALEEDVSEQF